MHFSLIFALLWFFYVIMRPYRIYMKKGEYKLKKQIFRNLCRFLVFILMFSCFFVFGKKVSANENQNAAPIITYYRLNGNDITIQWKAPDGVSYSEVDIIQRLPQTVLIAMKIPYLAIPIQTPMLQKVFLIIIN